MDSTSPSSRIPVLDAEKAKTDIIAGLVSSAIAIPLAMAFGMFAFVSLGDEYFAYGAMAAVLLFLVQLGNVMGFDHNVRFTRVFASLGEARPLSIVIAVLTFTVMWN